MVHIPNKIKNKRYSYATSAMRLNCFSDIHEFFNNTNDPIKELSESIGIFKRVQKDITDLNVKSFDELRKTSEVLVIVIGDGTTPRTASLFVTMTKWHVLSIDPAMRIEKKSTHKLNRLYPIKQRLEDFNIARWQSFINRFSLRLLIYPHAHADFTLGVNMFKPHFGFTLPCCCLQKQLLNTKSLTQLVLGERAQLDPKILSPHNRLYSYTFTRVST